MVCLSVVRVLPQPVWLRNPKQVTPEEYTEFYRTTFRMYDEPANLTHFSLEGQVRQAPKTTRCTPSPVVSSLTRPVTPCSCIGRPYVP